MIDQEDFDPMGKQWNPAHNDFLSGASSEKVADEALRVATVMLRVCKGCSILPHLHEILWEYYTKISEHALWSPTLKEADALLYKKLESLTKEDGITDKRIETIAIRSTKKMALYLRENKVVPLRYSQLQTRLASLLIKDLIGHSFLDLARAMSVGKRFATHEQAFEFYSEVIEHIEPGATQIGRRLVRKPTAERLKGYRILKNTHTTRSMLYDEEFRFDL